MAESNPEIPKNIEQKEAREYNEEDIENLLFWSFFMSQGYGVQHGRVLDLLVYSNPSITRVLDALKSELPEDPSNWSENDPLIEPLLQRLVTFFNSQSHRALESEREPKSWAMREIRRYLGHLLSYKSRLSNLQKENQGKGQFSPIATFTDTTIRKDLEFLKKAETDNDLSNARARHGGSMICRYALSDKREMYRRMLPKEFQQMWEEAGEYVRSNSLNSNLEKKLQVLITAYEQTTGEKITLSRNK